MVRERIRKRRRLIVWLLLGVILTALIMATPFLLQWGSPDGMDWAELGDISQTYAAISIPFSGLALLGVVVSLAYQARQVHIDREGAQLAAHRELTMRLLDDPDLFVCWGPPGRPMTATRARQHAYVNLIISFWHADFLVGRLAEQAVPGAAANLFRGEIGREFWELQGDNWKATTAAQGRRNALFARLVDEGYARALGAGPPTPAAAYFLPASG